MPATTEYPQGAPELAVRSWKEIEGYTDIPKDGQIAPEQMRELRHGYYACVSYMDALVGRLLDELDRLKLAENTVIVLVGDHGYHLGEQGLWSKVYNYELSTRAPLILCVPQQAKRGAKVHALVELVDIYPTLVDVCELNAPVDMEGISLKPLLADPDRSWKRAVFSQFPRALTASRSRGHGEFMGYAIRSDRYRYVEWRNWESGKIVSRELYDRDEDSDESYNVAELSTNDQVVSRLSRWLNQGWQGSLPTAISQEP